MAQSGAMLRYAGQLATANGVPLYPADRFLEMEEALGFVEDVKRDWMWPLYFGMKVDQFGYDKEADNSAVVEKVRTAFVTNKVSFSPGFPPTSSPFFFALLPALCVNI